MPRFSKLTVHIVGEPVESDVRVIPQSALDACPHHIMLPEHYRATGTCRCDDYKHKEMRAWGYRWSKTTHRWE